MACLQGRTSAVRSLGSVLLGREKPASHNHSRRLRGRGSAQVQNNPGVLTVPWYGRKCIQSASTGYCRR